MIVIGAGGLASEILQILTSNKYNYTEDNLFFFDNITKDIEESFFGKYKILRSFEEVEAIFRNESPEFCLGIGGYKARRFLSNKFSELGGISTTIISEQANISEYNTKIGKGSVIIGNAQITSNVTIGDNCLVYMNTSITHDNMIGDFVEISPNVGIAGRCTIGDYSFIGIGVNILPDIKIGERCVIGAGTLVNKNIQNKSVVVGVPVKVIEKK